MTNIGGEEWMVCPKCQKEVQDGSSFCNYCGTRIEPVNNEAVTNRTSNASENESKNKLKGIVIISLLIVIVALLALKAFNVNIDVNKMKYGEKYKIYDIAQESVKEYLTSPASAKFPNIDSDDVTINGTGDSYFVNSYVDSENGFGASLRTKFECFIEKDDDSWSTTIVTLDDKQYFPKLGVGGIPVK